MKSQFEHKNYIGCANYSPSSDLYFGHIMEIDDVVNYYGNSIIELEVAFIQAVDDYITSCYDLGREPNKPSKNPFS